MPKKKAVRNIISGNVIHYEGAKTRGIRDIVSGNIIKRVKTQDAQRSGEWTVKNPMDYYFPKKKRKNSSYF